MWLCWTANMKPHFCTTLFTFSLLTSALHLLFIGYTFSHSTCRQRGTKDNKQYIISWRPVTYIQTHTFTHTCTLGMAKWEYTNLQCPSFGGECNIPRSLNTSISQTFISALSASLFYCFLIYGSLWTKALTHEEDARTTTIFTKWSLHVHVCWGNTSDVKHVAWSCCMAIWTRCILKISSKICLIAIMCVNRAFPLFLGRIFNIWYSRGGLCKRQPGLTSLPTHSLIIITDWTNF